MMEANNVDELRKTTRGHQISNRLNYNKHGYCREVARKAACCLHLDSCNHRNRGIIHQAAAGRSERRMKPSKPPTRQIIICPTRRKLVQSSLLHYAIALLLLDLFFMTPIISSFTISPSQLQTYNTAVSSKISSIIIYSSFPQQHDEYNDDEDNDDNDVYNNNNNPQLYRQNYNQLGVITSTPNDRQRMIMNSMNQNDEDESYLNLHLDGDGEVMMDNNVNGGRESSINDGNLPVGRIEEGVHHTSVEQPKGGERINANAISSIIDRVGDNIIDVNANPRNGEKSPRSSSDIKTAEQLRSVGDTINNGESTLDNRKEASYRTGISNGDVANNGIESRVPPLNNAAPMSATEASPDANDFRQQFISRTNINDSEQTSNNTNEQAPTTPASTSSSSTKRKRVTTEEIEFIKSTIPLTDVIETYNLDGFTRTNTHSAKACCPFHDDNNPSMSIDDNRGLYKCFACGAGGDVFNFIREYDYIEKKKRSGEDTKMGYMQAVEYAAREFGDDRLVSGWNFGKSGDAVMYEGMSEEAKEKMMERQRKKERIRQANTAAAAFYTKCLVTLSTAGKARAHLRSRNISPESVRVFALGYAPDCYYGDEASSSNTWGDGSLVNYLAKMEFTSDEIVEAGLAVRTKKKKKFQMEDSEEEKPNDADTAANDYSSLMDRFRSRLIIPILDDSGQHVIAFGGRHLESVATSEDAKSENFTPAKYINSPDSLVFTKKNVLFNKYKAQEAVNARSSESNSSPSLTFNAPKGVVIVEGYFDAIALSNVGVKNVVASMGTALPPEQLKIAAEMGKVPGGT